MSDSVLIKRNGEETTVLRRFLSDYLADGWQEVNKDSDREVAERNKKAIEEENERQKELERLAAKGRKAEEDERKLAEARVEKENQDFQDEQRNRVIESQLTAMKDERETHESYVMGSEDKEEVADYIEEKLGKKVDKRGDLEKVQEKALAVIDEHYKEIEEGLKA